MAEEIEGGGCGAPPDPRLHVLPKPSPYPYTPASTVSLNPECKVLVIRFATTNETWAWIQSFKKGQLDCRVLEKYEYAAQLGGGHLPNTSSSVNGLTSVGTCTCARTKGGNRGRDTGYPSFSLQETRQRYKIKVDFSEVEYEHQYRAVPG